MILRSLFAGVVTAVLISESASALSCMQPDLAKAMEAAKASDKTYHILVGKFVSPPKSRVQSPQNVTSTSTQIGLEDQFKPKPPKVTQAQFNGYALTPNRRTDARLTQYLVDIETQCVGPWCSSVPDSNTRNIAFVQARPNQTPILKISPCPQWVYRVDPAEAQIKKLRTCFDKSCHADPQENYSPRER